MIHGYRWIKTAPDVWQFEGPPKSRRFHGLVYVWEDGSAIFSLPGGTISSFSDGRVIEHGSGHRATVRIAKDEIELAIRVSLGLCCEHGVKTGDYCETCNKEYKEAESENRVFENCNVCGRKLHTKDEDLMGMCRQCAAE